MNTPRDYIYIYTNCVAYDSFFTSPNGAETWNVYHATGNSNGACDGNRYTMAQKVNWDSNGYPVFGTPPPLSQTITGPAGEPA